MARESKERFKTELSRADYREHIAITYWNANHYFTKWYPLKKALIQKIKNERNYLITSGLKPELAEKKLQFKYYVEYSNLSYFYDLFVKFTLETWGLIREYISETDLQREGFDLKLDQLTDGRKDINKKDKKAVFVNLNKELTAGEVRDLFYELSKKVKRLVPLADYSEKGDILVY